MSAALSMAGCSRDAAPPATEGQPASAATPSVAVATSSPQSGAAAATRPIDTTLVIWAEADPDEGEAPLATLLTADPLEDIEGAQYSWDFGDGSPASTEQNPKHTYARPGEYTARVRVTDKDGNLGIDEVAVIVVAPEAPAAGSGEQPTKDGAS